MIARTLTSRRAWTFNAWLTAALLIGIVVAANRLAKDHLRARVDLSEEQLFAPSPVAERMLGSLDDVLAVKAYFTGEVKHGPVQLAKSRLLDHLAEYSDIARGRMEITFADPNASSEARVEAQRYGVEPVPLRAVQGTSELTQEVYLGLVLRYRGREAVLPFVLPQTFAYGFLSELAGLLSDERAAVGFLSGDGLAADGDRHDGFQEIRGALQERYRLVEISDLADGVPVPDDVGLVVVARPHDLHPRAAFELDQHVQRGGRLFVLAESVRIDLNRLEAALVESGVESLLAAWGVALGEDLVWDSAANYLSIEGVGRTQYPFWINVADDGMERSVPVVGRLPGMDLFWAHPVLEADVAGLSRTALVRSSPDSWLVPPDEAMQTGGSALNARAVELTATAAGARRDLVVALSGSFPSAFESVPGPRDAVEDTVWMEARRAALEAGETPPPRPVRTVAGEVRSGGEGGAVVVVGDADWASDGKFLTARNRLLFENIVDWLNLADELVELRATLPRERKIEDLLEQEKIARGLPTLAGTGALALEGVDPTLLAEAERAADGRRRKIMATATGGALGLAALVAVLGRLLLGGGRRAADPQPTGGAQ